MRLSSKCLLANLQELSKILIGFTNRGLFPRPTTTCENFNIENHNYIFLYPGYRHDELMTLHFNFAFALLTLTLKLPLHPFHQSSRTENVTITQIAMYIFNIIP